MSRVTRLFVRLTRIAALCSCCASQVCIATSNRISRFSRSRLYEEYAGNYQLAPDRVISLGPFSEAGGRLVFFDSQTRRFGVLYPLSETQFVTGTLQENGMVTPADLYVTFTRTPTGKVSAQLPPDELRLQAWRGPLAFDPIPYWEKVSCPVLAIYGELDKNTPTARNVPPLVAALKRGGNRDYTIIILPKTDHHFYENATESLGYFAEIAAMQRFVPGYVDRMMNWIAQRASD